MKKKERKGKGPYSVSNPKFFLRFTQHKLQAVPPKSRFPYPCNHLIVLLSFNKTLEKILRPKDEMKETKLLTVIEQGKSM